MRKISLHFSPLPMIEYYRQLRTAKNGLMEERYELYCI